MKKFLLVLAIMSSIMASDNPWEDEEDFECYAEAGMNCEELAEQWDEEHPEETEDD